MKFLSKRIGRKSSSSEVNNKKSSSSDNSLKTQSGRLTGRGSFRVSKEELEAALRRLASDPHIADEEVTSMMNEMECDSDGCISLEEGETDGAGEGRVQELRDAFRVLGAEGDGKISAEELLRVFAALGDEELTVEDCKRMIKGVDSYGDGFVCFQDFVKMMMQGI